MELAAPRLGPVPGFQADDGLLGGAVEHATDGPFLLGIEHEIVGRAGFGRERGGFGNGDVAV